MRRTFRYEEIAADLRDRLTRGAFSGKKLPSERSLMAHYRVQRNTVRRALAILEEEGEIVRLSKRGAFVTAEIDTGGDVGILADTPPGSGMNLRADDQHSINAAVCVSGSVLVVSQWNEMSTALESLLRGLSRSLAGSPLSVLYFDSRPRQGKTHNELPTEEYLRAHTVRAIVLWPQSPADAQELTRLRSFAPLILVDRQVTGFETHSVAFDDFAGGYAVTEHLLQLGHRRIGFLTDEAFAETVQQRWRGYAHALEDAGIAAEPTCYGLFQGMWDPPYTAQMRLLLEGGGRALTAVVCSNDTVALDFMNFLRREGHQVPGRIAVTGFGNLLPNSTEAMRLTTVRQPFDEVGEAAGRVLLSHMGLFEHAECPGTVATYEHIKIPVQLVVHASSGSNASPAAQEETFRPVQNRSSNPS